MVAADAAALDEAILRFGVGLVMTHDAAPPMPAKPYRVLLLDAAGRVLRTKILPACDDVEAQDRARVFMDGRAVELWDRNRLVLRLDPSDTSAV